MLAKVRNVTSAQAALLIAIVGAIVYSSGLTSPFQGDDLYQIVNNVPVHSLSNIRLFFSGGTFYNGNGIPLVGAYFRPLTPITYSMLYTVFGPHVIPFHVFQLLLYISSAILLYLVFRYSFKPALALLLALIFLVHPLNSQVAFTIPNMQDALFFFFGILALWVLLRFQSRRALIPVAIALFLSLLAKETAVVFVVLCALYLFWFNRRRLYTFLGTMVPPLVLYTALRVHAIGWIGANPNNAPIDHLSLAGRLLTAPSIVLFYLTKFVFPWHLATMYYWTNPTFSVRHVLLPLIIDLAVLILIGYSVLLVRRKATKEQYYTYLFFLAWFVLGILPYLQLIPLDMTAAEAWFYFGMVGLLGMIGVVVGIWRIRLSWIVLVGAVVIGLLGLRTFLRGLDYGNPYTLAQKNISASKEDFNAYDDLANVLISKNEFSEAKPYALRSIGIYPTFENYNSLGIILMNLHDYPAAEAAYDKGLSYGNSIAVNENIGELTLLYGNATSDGQFYTRALGQFPSSANLWMDLAIVEDQYNANDQAKTYILKAASYGQIPPGIYNSILADKPFTLHLANATIQVQ